MDPNEEVIKVIEKRLKRIFELESLIEELSNKERTRDEEELYKSYKTEYKINRGKEYAPKTVKT
jgi:hypothetical protein